MKNWDDPSNGRKQVSDIINMTEIIQIHFGESKVILHCTEKKWDFGKRVRNKSEKAVQSLSYSAFLFKSILVCAWTVTRPRCKALGEGGNHVQKSAVMPRYRNWAKSPTAPSSSVHRYFAISIGCQKDELSIELLKLPTCVLHNFLFFLCI